MHGEQKGLQVRTTAFRVKHIHSKCTTRCLVSFLHFTLRAVNRSFRMYGPLSLFGHCSSLFSAHFGHLCAFFFSPPCLCLSSCSPPVLAIVVFRCCCFLLFSLGLSSPSSAASPTAFPFSRHSLLRSVCCLSVCTVPLSSRPVSKGP